MPRVNNFYETKDSLILRKNTLKMNNSKKVKEIDICVLDTDSDLEQISADYDWLD